MTFSSLSAFAFVGGAGTLFANELIGAMAVDGNTLMPISAAVSAGITIFLIGMWVARNQTRTEDKIQTMEKQLEEVSIDLKELKNYVLHCPVRQRELAKK